MPSSKTSPNSMGSEVTRMPLASFSPASCRPWSQVTPFPSYPLQLNLATGGMQTVQRAKLPDRSEYRKNASLYEQPFKNRKTRTAWSATGSSKSNLFTTCQKEELCIALLHLLALIKAIQFQKVPRSSRTSSGTVMNGTTIVM